MMVIIRFLLSVSTLGISEFFFTAPLPSGPRAFIAICSLGLSEFAFRKNVKFFVVEIAILAVIGAVTGQGGGSTGSNTAVTTPTAAGDAPSILISGDVEGLTWDCSDGRTGANFLTVQQYVPNIKIKLSKDASAATKLLVTVKRSGNLLVESISGTAASGVTFEDSKLEEIQISAEDPAGVQPFLYLSCTVKNGVRKPVPSIALPSQTPTPTVTTWYPDGYFVWSGDSDLAWRWMPHRKLDCTYSSGSCWGIYVISKSGCSSSLYAELTIFNKNNVQIDYSNDLTSSVGPFTKVQLIFDTFNDAANSGRLSQLSCY